jgi:pimeloyl-ACP methyl ester carboxylesterase
VAVFALIHGSGDGGWAWHLVQRILRDRGHEAVAPDLPTDREDATWDDCVDVVVDAVAGADDVVLVGQSSGGFVVPLVAHRRGALLQVFVAGMVPQPGESAGEWFGDVGWFEAVAEQAREDGGLTGNSDPMIAFYHDVPADLARQAMARERPASERLAETPWPLPTWPKVPARYVVTTEDHFLPLAVQRRVAAERLSLAHPDEIVSGHCPNLSRPEELADLLVGYLANGSLERDLSGGGPGAG